MLNCYKTIDITATVNKLFCTNRNREEIKLKWEDLEKLTKLNKEKEKQLWIQEFPEGAGYQNCQN